MCGCKMCPGCGKSPNWDMKGCGYKLCFTETQMQLEMPLALTNEGTRLTFSSKCAATLTLISALP